jgi:3'-5' exoribonuclease
MSNLPLLQQTPLAGLPAGANFEGIYRIEEICQRVDVNDNPYWRMTLTDASGTLTGYGWPSHFRGNANPESFALAAVSGRTRIYQDNLATDVHTLAGVPPNASFSHLTTLPASLCPRADLLPRLLVLTQSLRIHSLVRFVETVFADDRIALPFLLAPGSARHHHSRPGGLLEHSIEVAEIVGSLSMS